LTQDEAASEPGKLRLRGSSAGYDKTIAIAGNFTANPTGDGTVDVHFETVPTNGQYSLSYIAADGTETTIVDNAAVSALKDDSLPPEPTPAPTPAP
jgi:hypothetical protein